MPPKKSCSCKSHDDIVKSDDNSSISIFNIESSKKLKKSALNYLVTEGLLQKKPRYLCNYCYEYAIRNTEYKRYTVEELCTSITEDILDEAQIIHLCQVMGKKFKNILVNVTVSLDMAYLQSLNADEQIDSMDKSILCFLSAIASDGYSKKVKIVNTYEHLISLTNTNFIGPLNFALNLISLCDWK